MKQAGCGSGTGHGDWKGQSPRGVFSFTSSQGLPSRNGGPVLPDHLIFFPREEGIMKICFGEIFKCLNVINQFTNL